MVAKLEDRPLAVKGLTSYRYRSRYGWIMIGARNDADALSEARRSTDGPVVLDRLEVWNGSSYEPVRHHANAHVWAVGDTVKLWMPGVVSREAGQIGTITEMHERHSGSIRYTVKTKYGEVYVSDGNLRPAQTEKNPTVQLTKQQLATAKVKLKKFYQLKRTITTEEVRATLEMLTRRRGDYDDVMADLAATLQTGAHPIAL